MKIIASVTFSNGISKDFSSEVIGMTQENSLDILLNTKQKVSRMMGIGSGSITTDDGIINIKHVSTISLRLER